MRNISCIYKLSKRILGYFSSENVQSLLENRCLGRQRKSIKVLLKNSCITTKNSDVHLTKKKIVYLILLKKKIEFPLDCTYLSLKEALEETKIERELILNQRLEFQYTLELCYSNIPQYSELRERLRSHSILEIYSL